MEHKNLKILTSKEEIKTYLGNITDYMFQKYIKLGMPARYEDCRWLAHTDNIDEFFRIYTKVHMKNVPDPCPPVPGPCPPVPGPCPPVPGPCPLHIVST